MIILEIELKNIFIINNSIYNKNSKEKRQGFKNQKIPCLFELIFITF